MSADGKHQARVARMVFISMEGTFKRLVFVVSDSVIYSCIFIMESSKDAFSINQFPGWSKMLANCENCPR